MTSENKQEFLARQNLYNRLLSEQDHYGAKSNPHGWAGNFHRYRVAFLKDIFTKFLNCQKDTRILDIGSAHSMFAEIFKPEDCPNVTSFDISTVIIEKARRTYPHIKFLVDDAQEPSIQGKFDIVFAGEILEHLPEPEEAVDCWSELVAEKGYLVITTPNRLFSRKNQEHISLLTISQMKKLLLKSGFKMKKIRGIDIPNPFLDRILEKIAKLGAHFSRISDSIFQIKMRSALGIPWLAHDITYIAQKR